MIRLAGSNIEVAYSPEYSHPVLNTGSGNSVVNYVWTHNKGKAPINIWLETTYSDSTDWLEYVPLYYSGGSLVGWRHGDNGLAHGRADLNTVRIDAARISSSTTPVRIAAVFA